MALLTPVATIATSVAATMGMALTIPPLTIMVTIGATTPVAITVVTPNRSRPHFLPKPRLFHSCLKLHGLPSGFPITPPRLHLLGPLRASWTPLLNGAPTMVRTSMLMPIAPPILWYCPGHPCHSSLDYPKHFPSKLVSLL